MLELSSKTQRIARSRNEFEEQYDTATSTNKEENSIFYSQTSRNEKLHFVNNN